MYYLASINDYGALVIKDTEDTDFCDVLDNIGEASTKDYTKILGVSFEFEKTKVITKAELNILKYLDYENYSWVQKTVDYSTIPSSDLIIVDDALNFKNDSTGFFGETKLTTLPMLVLKYLTQSVSSSFIYELDGKLYVLADFVKNTDSNTCECTYRVYPIKNVDKFHIAITKGVIWCK